MRSTLFAVACGIFQIAFAQNKECTQNNFIHQYHIHKTDTFLIVQSEYETTSEFLESTTIHSYLYKIQNDQLDTILNLNTSIAENYDEAGSTIHSGLLSDYVYSLRHNDSYDYDSTIYSFFLSYIITPIKANVIGVLESEWEYTGGAHGNGTSNYSHFDLDSNQYFSFEDVFKPSVMEPIYEKVKNDFFYDGKYYGLSSEEFDSTSEGLRYLTDQQYQFTEDSLIVCVQMYDTLFGVIYIGYNYWQMGIAYKDLKRHMHKESAIRRMLKY